MRFSHKVRDKMFLLVENKFIQIYMKMFEEEGMAVVSTWSRYLEGIGCRRVHKEKIRHGKDYVMIKDPIWHGDQIVMPRELMMKILFLGEMP